MVKSTRWRSALGAALLAPLGYSLRFAPQLPEWLRDASGGTLYVAFWALAAGVVWPLASALRLAGGALVFTCMVEALQLWHPAWLDTLRRTLPGRLVLGSTFAWGDFPPYVAGALLAYGILCGIRR